MRTKKELMVNDLADVINAALDKYVQDPEYSPTDYCEGVLSLALTIFGSVMEATDSKEARMHTASNFSLHVIQIASGTEELTHGMKKYLRGSTEAVHDVD